MDERNKQEKTRYKLAASMKECMKSAPVDKITVKEIVVGCGVTRQTFYRNFLDKYDLINWYFDKLVLQSFEQIGMGHTVGESLTQKFEFIVNEKVFFTEAFRSDDRNSLKEHDFELILQFYTDLLARKDSRALDQELQDSKQTLEKITGKEVQAIAYPYSDYDQRVCTAAAKYYRFGYIDWPKNYYAQYEIGRTSVHRDITIEQFEALLH